MADLKNANELNVYTTKCKEVEDEKKRIKLEKTLKLVLPLNFQECVKFINDSASKGYYSIHFDKQLSESDQNILKQQNYKIKHHSGKFWAMIHSYYEISWK